MEIWTTLKGFELTHWVSTEGRVQNIVTGNILTPMKTGNNRKSGYCAKIRVSTKPIIDISIAKAILESFGQIKPNIDSVVMHLNDDPMDNRIQNLKWGTRQENSRDSAKKCRGGIQKLPPEIVQDIYFRRKLGESGVSLAIEYGISQQRVCDIYKGRTTLL